MRTFQELYQDILEQEVGKGRKITGDYNPVHMDCLLHPEKYAAVLPGGEPCTCGKDAPCIKSCLFSK